MGTPTIRVDVKLKLQSLRESMPDLDLLRACTLAGAFRSASVDTHFSLLESIASIGNRAAPCT